MLALFATFPWFDRLARDAGQADLALAAALTGLAMVATGVLIAMGDVGLAGWTSVIGTVFLPLAAGAAILRYRLYDLDQIISVQATVDRRFNRPRHDAARIIEGFGTRLRDQSTSTPSPPRCWPWPPRRCSRPERRCGCGRRPEPGSVAVVVAAA